MSEEPKTQVRQLLEAMTAVRKTMYASKEFHYCGIEDFILQHGIEFDSSRIHCPKEHRGKLHECFSNAMHHALSSKSIYYVEGYALSHENSIPVYHAWCTDLWGDVIEVTWEKGHTYFGVPFDPMWAARQAMKRGFYGLLDAPEVGWETLRTPFNPQHYAKPWKRKAKTT